MTIPPQMLMMLPGLLGGLMGGNQGRQGGLMAAPMQNLLPQGQGFQMGGQQDLLEMLMRRQQPFFNLGLPPELFRRRF